MNHGRPIACEARTSILTKLFTSRVAAGFPSPADDYLDHPLDFNEVLIAHPAATFAVRVTGESMIGIGIYPGDIAVVDRALTATDDSIILGILDGEFTIKRYRRTTLGLALEAANPSHRTITINENQSFEVWGVVRHTIRKLL